MSEAKTVTSVVDPEVNSGMGKKGKWTQALIELDDGQQVRIFQPIKVGDKVESYQNGEYTNWRIVKADNSAMSEEVMQMLQVLYNQQQEIARDVKRLLGEEETKVVKPTPTKDTVVEVDPNEPINLDDINS